MTLPFTNHEIDPLRVPIDQDQLAVGTRVKHSIFGEGTVVANPNKRPSKDDVPIIFDQHGEKVLMWSFCRSKIMILAPPDPRPPRCPFCRCEIVHLREIRYHEHQSACPPDGWIRFTTQCALCGARGPLGASFGVTKEEACRLWGSIEAEGRAKYQPAPKPPPAEEAT